MGTKSRARCSGGPCVLDRVDFGHRTEATLGCLRGSASRRTIGEKQGVRACLAHLSAFGAVGEAREGVSRGGVAPCATGRVREDPCARARKTCGVTRDTYGPAGDWFCVSLETYGPAGATFCVSAATFGPAGKTFFACATGRGMRVAVRRWTSGGDNRRTHRAIRTMRDGSSPYPRENAARDSARRARSVDPRTAGGALNRSCVADHPPKPDAIAIQCARELPPVDALIAHPL